MIETGYQSVLGILIRGMSMGIRVGSVRNLAAEEGISLASQIEKY